MKTTLENNKLTIYLEGRIDSNNAPAVEQEMMSAVRNASGANVVLDADKLEYISSAGLRMLMKLHKQTGTVLSILNASAEVYGVFEVTGFTNLFDVRKRLHQVCIDGCEIIGRGGNGVVLITTKGEYERKKALEAERAAAREAKKAAKKAKKN